MARQAKRDLQRLGRYIAAARRAHYGTVQAAIKAAGVNQLTWTKAERGDPIREDRLTAIEKALGWDIGDGWVIADGGEPLSQGGSGVAGGAARSLGDYSDADLLDELRNRLSSRARAAS